MPGHSPTTIPRFPLFDTRALGYRTTMRTIATTSSVRGSFFIAGLLVAGIAGCGQEASSPAWEDSLQEQARTSPNAPSFTAASWVLAGPLLEGRTDFGAANLDNNKIFLQGGWGESALLDTAEVYDVLTDTWTSAGVLPTPRPFAVVAPLPSGKAMVTAGGCNGIAYDIADIYDSQTNTWSTAAPMLTGRCSHTATALADGRVLVAGGWPYVLTAEIYDPVTNQWSPTAPMTKTRAYHKAVRLPNGNVLVAGGQGMVDNNDAEIYNPTTNTWTQTGTSSYYDVDSLTPLADGRALATFSAWTPNARVQIFDPNTNTWSNAPDMIVKRMGHTSTLLHTGKVLVAGGSCDADEPDCDWSDGGYLKSAELYDPFTNNWSTTASLNETRMQHAAFRLNNNKVLAFGGINGSVTIAGNNSRTNPNTSSLVLTTTLAGSSELYTPESEGADCSGVVCNPTRDE